MDNESTLSTIYSEDVSLMVVILDINPLFWTSVNSNTNSLTFTKFMDQFLPLLNSVLLLNQLNEIVLIAHGINSCGYIYNSSMENRRGGKRGPAFFAEVSEKLKEFMEADCLHRKGAKSTSTIVPSLLSGSLSLALCYIQRVFRSRPIYPRPRILCLQGSPDGPEQYVAVMNAIFSAQRSSVLIDSCVLGLNSAFLQQASHITGGVYIKPQQLDGLFQCLSMVFATDVQSRSFLQLPKPAGVDFRASCFCHKTTISMGYICSVCLSIFCKRHKKCSTCGSDFNRPNSNSKSSPVQKSKRKLDDR
ncbi:putative RNA polymerase II transcription factor B subunit [Zostera marina]|uniref:General transcription and DNA repair factor IIH subunit TFB4 n=1 Tax=Zostera marina TaxID=29655 RepID=A0A0K9PYY4_ZOSMR|nr:putative RNA polymerase II transcription factor B subunit [Zostera marina]